MECVSESFTRREQVRDFVLVSAALGQTARPVAPLSLSGAGARLAALQSKLSRFSKILAQTHLRRETWLRVSSKTDSRLCERAF